MTVSVVPFPILALQALLALCNLLQRLLDEDEKARVAKRQQLCLIAATARYLQDEERQTKKQCCMLLDRAAAKESITRDYLGPYPCKTQALKAVTKVHSR